MTNQKYCLMYKGMAIEGFSSSNNCPIFSALDKFTPNLTFETYESALISLNMMMVENLGKDTQDIIDFDDVRIGAIQIQTHEISIPSGYDNALKFVLENPYVGANLKKEKVAQIMHLCVRHGFRKILPNMYPIIMNDPVYHEVIERNVPFFVQQNMERFMDVGIITCTQDEIAAIILTSSDELLNAIHIDSLNNVSK